jgi:hypothetical protein
MRLSCDSHSSNASEMIFLKKFLSYFFLVVLELEINTSNVVGAG